MPQNLYGFLEDVYFQQRIPHHRLSPPVGIHFSQTFYSFDPAQWNPAPYPLCWGRNEAATVVTTGHYPLYFSLVSPMFGMLCTSQLSHPAYISIRNWRSTSSLHCFGECGKIAWIFYIWVENLKQPHVFLLIDRRIFLYLNLSEPISVCCFSVPNDSEPLVHNELTPVGLVVTSCREVGTSGYSSEIGSPTSSVVPFLSSVHL